VDLRLVFSGQGPLLTLEVYDLANLATPLATISDMDATHASGNVGVLTTGLVDDRGGFNNTPLDATFDNFSAVPEPATSMLVLAGIAGVFRVRRFGCRRGVR
jgi:hypothetical protein